MNRILRIALAFVVALAGLAAQALPGFEVASIRPHAGPLTAIDTFSYSGPQLRGEGVTAPGLVRYAYDLKMFQLADTPNLPREVYYDLLAKSSDNRTLKPDEFRPLVRSLLEERFKLKIHREMREMAVYALVAGKNGPKLKASAAETERYILFGSTGRNQNFSMKKVTLEEVAAGIMDAFSPNRPVINRTDVTGFYDVNLEATPEYRLIRGDVPNEAGDVSVFTAVQQLGLKLEPQKAMIEVVVVDHIEKPTGN